MIEMSAEDQMRQRFAADGVERCGAPLHGDKSTRCLAEPHSPDVAHVSEVNAPQLGVTNQLVQWHDIPDAWLWSPEMQDDGNAFSQQG